jgi:hypothetical protein
MDMWLTKEQVVAMCKEKGTWPRITAADRINRKQMSAKRKILDSWNKAAEKLALTSCSYDYIVDQVLKNRGDIKKYYQCAEAALNEESKKLREWLGIRIRDSNEVKSPPDRKEMVGC